MINMTYWCENCARKNNCCTISSKPKCFTPIINTAHGTHESYLTKALRFSQDNHEIAKTEPQTWTKENCKGCKYNEYPYDSGTCFVRVCINGNKYEPKDEPKTEPQTERSE